MIRVLWKLFTPRLTLLGVAFCVITNFSRVQAELLPMDALSREWGASQQALSQGQDRLAIASQLGSVAEKNPDSWWHDRSVAVADAMAGQAEKLQGLHKSGLTAESAPWLWLGDSYMPHFVLQLPENKASLDTFLKQHPDDPASKIIAQGREMIPLLIPLLNDMGPARSSSRLYPDMTTEYPRVCDLALALIEYFSGCSFCETTFSQGAFGNLDESVRLNALNEAQEWWQTSGHLPFLEGVQACMPQGGVHGKIKMGRLLLQSADPQSHAVAQRELHQLADSANPVFAAYVGKVLEPFGDTYCRTVINGRLRQAFAKGPARLVVGPEVIFFLVENGGREEWELLTQCAQQQLTAKAAGGGQFIISTLRNCYETSDSMYAIPSLALVFQTGMHPGS